MKNLSFGDRLIRFVLADMCLGIGHLGIELPPSIVTGGFLLSVYLFITLIFGYSPIYHLLGVNTKTASEGVEE